MTIRVLIADDQEMVRAGFRMMLETQPDFEVVADVGNGIDAVRLARESRPDVCLLDIRMPGIDGLEATRQLAGGEARDPIKVVVVTTFDHDEYVETALANGASGFLLKETDPALLLAAVRAAERGDALISPEITVRLLEHVRHSTGRRRTEVTANLTDRERDVAMAVAQGETNTEIAERLYMSLSTVKTHIATVQQKLQVRNRVGIAVWAWRSGLMD